MTTRREFIAAIAAAGFAPRVLGSGGIECLTPSTLFDSGPKYVAPGDTIRVTWKLLRYDCVPFAVNTEVDRVGTVVGVKLFRDYGGEFTQELVWAQ